LVILFLLAGLCFIASFVATILIVIDAFQDEWWKGLLGFFCGLYLLYYAVVEYSSDKKWLIIATALGGSIVGGVFMAMAGGMAASAR
jgi:hypothetical protein